MKNAWGLAILLSVASAPGAAQTTAELINDARTPENVLLHSMGYDRKSYSPLDQINTSNVHRLARISLVPSTRSWYSCGEEGTDGCVLPGFTDAGTQGQRRRHGVEAGGGKVCGESGVGRPPEAAAARDG